MVGSLSWRTAHRFLPVTSFRRYMHSFWRLSSCRGSPYICIDDFGRGHPPDSDLGGPFTIPEGPIATKQKNSLIEARD
jgi:hypothetical protein